MTRSAWLYLTALVAVFVGGGWLWLHEPSARLVADAPVCLPGSVCFVSADWKGGGTSDARLAEAAAPLIGAAFSAPDYAPGMGAVVEVLGIATDWQLRCDAATRGQVDWTSASSDDVRQRCTIAASADTFHLRGG
jgi:hypothetical protein